MTQNKTSETRFFNQLRQFGFKRFFWSADFVLAACLLVAMLLAKYLGLEAFAVVDNNYVIGIVAAASTLFAITLAALAIILSFSSSKFVEFLRDHQKLSPLLFSFWLGNGAYLIVITLSFAYLILGDEFKGVKISLYPFIASIFLYALIDTFYLLGTVIRFGYFMDIFHQSEKGK